MSTRSQLALFGFVAVAAYFLWTEHQAHVIQFLPLVLLLACPLMHLFHHGGHGSHGHDTARNGRNQDSSSGRHRHD